MPVPNAVADGAPPMATDGDAVADGKLEPVLDAVVISRWRESFDLKVM